MHKEVTNSHLRRRVFQRGGHRGRHGCSLRFQIAQALRRTTSEVAANLRPTLVDGAKKFRGAGKRGQTLHFVISRLAFEHVNGAFFGADGEEAVVRGPGVFLHGGDDKELELFRPARWGYRISTMRAPDSNAVTAAPSCVRTFSSSTGFRQLPILTQSSRPVFPGTSAR